MTTIMVMMMMTVMPIKMTIIMIIHQMEAARKELNKELESEAGGGDDEKVSLLQMLRTPNLRVNAFLCALIW